MHGLPRFFGCVIFALVTQSWACKSTDSSAAITSSTLTVAGAIGVELATALPVCTHARRGAVYYVHAEAKLYYCDGFRFRTLRLPNPGGSHSLCAVGPADSACPNGGVEVASGVDQDRDGELDPAEITDREYACNGADGSSCSVTTDAQGVKTIECSDGTSAVISDGSPGVGWVVAVGEAPAGLCPAGGSTISAGPDADRDGVIDAVQSNQLVCNGNAGPSGPAGNDGAIAALRLTRFDTHDECPAGGVLAEAGLDRNGNGQLDDTEVESSEPICDGEDALLERTTVIEPGAVCEFGGERRDRGLDANGNDILDDSEVLSDLSIVNCFIPGDAVAGAALELDGAFVRGADLVSPAPRFVRYALDFGATGVDPDQLTVGARSALADPVTPQSVRIAYAIDLLSACCGAELLELNAGIDYLSESGESTDFRAEIQQRTAAVQVASANIPFPVTPEYAQTLWTTVLQRSLAAQANLAASSAVDKGIAVVFVSGAADAQILENAYQVLDGLIRADTVVLLVVTEGNDADL